MTGDGLKGRDATEGRGCMNKMVFARGVQYWRFLCAYVKISKSACVYRIALDMAVSGLLNVELMQILKFHVARIKAVECFHLLAFLTFCLYHNHVILNCLCLQCFDAVGWAAGRASGL